MASTQHPVTMEKLPSNVLTNIFIRLLAKQLAQMRCVSKCLNAFLSRSSFIKSHLQRSIQNNDDILLVFHKGFAFRFKPYLARPSRSPHLELTNFIKLPVNQHLKSSYGNVIGSVNGLICFNYGPIHDSVYYIWNPSLSACLALPPSSFPAHDYETVGISSRFGYDPKTDDYKIIKVSGDVLQPIMIPPSKKLLLDVHLKTVDYKVEIYSMRKGTWELINQRFPSHVSMFIHKTEVCADGLNGHLHWLGYADMMWKQQTIVGFDLGSETFCEIPLPDSILDGGLYFSTYLGILGGKLCVMAKVKDGGCEVWVMDEYGVAQSWVKHHVFSQFSGIVPYGFTLQNEFVFEIINNEVDDDYDDSYDDHRLGLYDPIAAKTKIFNIYFGVFNIVNYVDSLVWVDMSEQKMSCLNISGLQI